MPLRVGIVSAAHVHAPGFAAAFLANPQVHVAGVTDDDQARGQAFAQARGLPFYQSPADLLLQTDAVVVCSENMRHARDIALAVQHRQHILCEKPIAPTPGHARQIEEATHRYDRVLATAFPCPHSPGFKSVLAKINAGEIGQILAVCATNQGTCPHGWFIDPQLSGGGAMVDHVVHVADLLRRLLKEDPHRAQAQIGSNIYRQAWDDTAIVTVEFPSGRFATIDSSWSKPKDYKTWGNVKLNIVGERGLIEADLFVQGLSLYAGQGQRHTGTGSNLDQSMVDDFVEACLQNKPPTATLQDGLWASRVAIAAYASTRQNGQPAPV